MQPERRVSKNTTSNTTTNTTSNTTTNAISATGTASTTGATNTITASRMLAEFAVNVAYEDIPSPMLHEATRSLMNYFAVGLGGCRDRTIDIAFATYSEFAGPPQASLFGRSSKVDLLTAASLNAMAANVYDFDDTHTPTIIHPTAPVAAALFALAQRHRIDGRSFLAAFLVGVEVQCRLGNAISPYHYTKGWHITSTCAVVGVAAAVGRILGLSVDQMVWAFGSAATQACGLVECLGTMSKSASVGNAARNGLISAYLAKNGFDGPADPLVGVRGFTHVYGERADISALTQDLGKRWEIARNTYKPYPCGVVLNPVLDACLTMAQSATLIDRGVERIASIELTGHPLLRQRADRPEIKSGRESQVCAQHGVAVCLIRHKAGLQEFSDSAVNDPDIRALGAKVTFTDNETCSVDSATVKILFDDGTVISEHVQSAKGSVSNPLTDIELEDKLRTLCRYSAIETDPARLIEQVWRLDELADVSAGMPMAF